jgi:hypothetical protein
MNAVLTFASTELPACQAMRRPRHARPVRRSRHTATPSSWFVLWCERLHLDKSRTWDAWQAFISSEYSEVKLLAQQVMLWSHCPETAAALDARGVTPSKLHKCCELLLCEGKLSLAEANRLEAAILDNLTADGRWT